MADLVPSYFCYGCHELVNNYRTVQYVKNARDNGLFEETECCPSLIACGCPADDTGFTDPATDEVCWYDPAIPASAEFLGLWIVSSTGIYDSHFQESATSTVGRGVTIGRPTWTAKEMAFEAIVFSSSCRGQDYGLEYLRRTLETPDNGCSDPSMCQSGGCGTRNLNIRFFCPNEGELDDGLRTFLNVGTIDGLKISDGDRRDKCCCTMRRVTFTLASERPESYSFQGNCIDEDATIGFPQCWDWNAPCDGNSKRCTSCVTCGGTSICGQTDCDACEQCVGCTYESTVYLTPPEPPEVIKDCYTPPLEWAVQCCCPANQPTVRDTTYRIEIFSGHGRRNPDGSAVPANRDGLRNLRLMIFDNPIGLPCADTSQEAYDLWKGQDPCAELHIKALPADTILAIDGPSRTISAYCKNICIPADNLVFNACGGSVFPLLSSCSPKMICAEWALWSTPFSEQVGTYPTLMPAHIKVDMYNVHR